ncbi:type II CAAX endopeptidase family protein [Bacillus sp. FJAT-47783]|uniref:CPBP family intramembrane glutamic endopeptidase n=1 Tax=Bacillus sp. FJAT-47783 TaxID=2922712 RepID=UPI001FAD6FA3|nr:type II CAAX endopeptidase family protein [Bacillus sp. FJAT-47783]
MNETVKTNVQQTTPNYKPKITWKSILLFGISFLGLSVIIGFIAGIIQEITGKEVVDFLFTGNNVILMDAFMFLIVFILFKNIRSYILDACSFAPLKRVKTYGYLLLGIVILMASQYLFIEVLKVDDISVQPERFGIDEAKASVLQSFLLFLSLAIVTPIKEEFLYRGLIHRFLEERYHFLVGFFVSSIIFGLLHIGYPISATVMGMVFVGLYHLTKSLMVPIVLHMVWNLYAVILLLSA